MKSIWEIRQVWHKKHTILILVLMLLAQWGVLPTSLFAITAQASATIEAPVVIVITTEPKLQQIQPGNFIPIAISESETSSVTQSTTSAKARPRLVTKSSNNVVTGFTISGAPNTTVVVSFTSTSTPSENSDSEAGSSETDDAGSTDTNEADSSDTDTESSDTASEKENMVIAQFDSNGVSTISLGGSLQTSDGSSEGGTQKLTMFTVHF